MLGPLAPVLACPVCGAGLRAEPDAQAPRRLVCAAGHAYDVARQGHVSLLRGGHRHPGDTAEMVGHRLAFLDAGHYDPIAETVAGLAAAEGAAVPGVLLDIGGGPGRYAAKVLDTLPDRRGITFDASTAAARRAARAHPRLASVVADGTAAYPVRSGTVAAALCVFAPRNPAEIRRVLAPGGRLVVVTPTQGHLAQLRQALGLLDVAPDKAARLAAGLGEVGLTRRAGETVRRELALSAADVTHLALMGPSAFHVPPERMAERVAALRTPVAVRLEVTVEAYDAA